MQLVKILLTGFEPFGGSRINPSEQAVHKLTATKWEKSQLFPLILPVDGNEAPELVKKAIDTVRPEYVVCLGEAGKRQAISIERIGVNLKDYRIPDNSGNLIADSPIVPGGPDAYFCTLPVRKMLEAIQKTGVPAELSLSAGAYLCNQVLYEVLHHIAMNHLDIKAGFIHLPPLPEEVVNNPGPSMSLDTIITGITAALYTLIH